MKKFLQKVILSLEALLIVASPLLLINGVGSATLSPRAVIISSAIPSTTTTHTIAFTVPSTDPVGSMSFEYCTNSPLAGTACTVPVGLDLLTASLGTQSGNTGFSIDGGNSSANRLVLTRPVAPMSAVASIYSLDNVVNPSTTNQTVFVRMATHVSTDGTGTSIDRGSAAFAIVPDFAVDAFVPPYLTFCAGASVAINCSTVTGDRVDFGELEPDLTAITSTQFSGATNDTAGFVTYLNGTTMTSGSNVINALSSNQPSNPGTNQFGLNLRANTNPSAGVEPDGSGSSTATVNYNIPDSFRFVDGEALTSSAIPTDFRRFTATYIVNVINGQPAGVYSTTLTFTAIAAF